MCFFLTRDCSFAYAPRAEVYTPPPASRVQIRSRMGMRGPRASVLLVPVHVHNRLLTHANRSQSSGLRVQSPLAHTLSGPCLPRAQPLWAFAAVRIQQTGRRQRATARTGAAGRS